MRTGVLTKQDRHQHIVMRFKPIPESDIPERINRLSHWHGVAFIIRLVTLDRQIDFCHLNACCGHLGLGFGPSDHWDEYARQNGDDGDDHEHFHKSKSSGSVLSGNSILLHDYLSQLLITFTMSSEVPCCPSSPQSPYSTHRSKLPLLYLGS